MRIYRYLHQYFVLEVVLTGAVSVAALLLCPVLALAGIYPPVMIIFAVVGFYQAWNTFVAIANPEIVTIDGDSVSFGAWGRTDAYHLDGEARLRIREFPSAGKMYIRIGRSTILKGRYWLQTRQFSDGDELFRALLDLEFRLHPDTLKARARRVNTAYLASDGRARADSSGEDGTHVLS